MEKNLKIIISPDHSGLEVFDDIVIKIGVPYSKDDVNVVISPNITGYKEEYVNDDLEVRQFSVTEETTHTRKLYFNLTNKKKDVSSIGGKAYEIELMQIGKEKTDKGEFPFFEFFVKNKN